MKNKMKKLAAFAATALMAFSAPVCASAEVPKDAVVYGNNAYKCFKSSMMRTTAESECRSMGGHLVYINSTGEKDFLASKFNSGNYWVGAEYSGESWKWDDGTPVNEAFLPDSEPPADDSGFAVALLPGAGLSAAQNSDTHYYICEWEGGAAAFTTATTAATTQPTTVPATSAEPHATVPSTTVPETTTALSGIFPGVPETVSGADVKPRPSLKNPPLEAPETVLALPTVTEITEIHEPGVTDYFDSLDIGDTIYIYDDSFYYQIVGGDEVIISYYNGMDSDVDIPASIDGRPVKYIAARAFQGQSVSSAAIPPSVTTIDDTAFSNISKDFMIYGEKGSEAESFALAHGYGFTEKTFADETGGTVDEDTSGENTTDTVVTSSKKLRKIVIVLSALVALAAVGVFFGVKKYYSFVPPMGPGPGFRPGDEDEEDDDEDDEEDDEEADDENSEED